MPDLATRLDRLDWSVIEASLRDHGHAVIPAILSAAECRRLIGLYGDDRRFRKRVDMERHRFGVGDYAYFREPLPEIVASLRRVAYRRLAPIANRWMEAFVDRRRFPATLSTFRSECRRRGQGRPTPLLLRYAQGGYNRLHQDLYGEIVFPLQLTVFLSQPGIDYEGGEFLLVENTPRAQSRGEAILPARGEMVIFPVRERPVAGRRGWLRVGVRHGVSRLRAGSRFALGIIFHDAR